MWGWPLPGFMADNHIMMGIIRMLLAMTQAQLAGDMDAVMGYMHEFYFETAATILALEQKSEHSLAKAILQKVEEQGLHANEVSGFQALPGNCLTAEWNGSTLVGGSFKFISDQTKVSDNMGRQVEQLAEEGKTPLLFTNDGKLAGIIAVANVIKEDSPQAVRELQNMGIHVVMLTGDNERNELMRCGFCMSYERPQRNCEMSRFVVSYFME